jgi:hypothetical protein
MRNRLKREWWQLYGIFAGGALVSFVAVRLRPSLHAQMLALAVIVSVTYSLGWLWTEAHAELLRRSGVDAIAQQEAETGGTGLPRYSITFIVHAFDEGATEVRWLPSSPKALKPPTNQETSLKR